MKEHQIKHRSLLVGEFHVRPRSVDDVPEAEGGRAGPVTAGYKKAAENDKYTMGYHSILIILRCLFALASALNTRALIPVLQR